MKLYDDDCDYDEEEEDTKLSISCVLSSEVDEVIQLFRQYFQLPVDVLRSMLNSKYKEYPPQQNFTNCRTIVLKRGEEIVGAASVRLHRPKTWNGQFVEVILFAAHKEYSGRGFGGLLSSVVIQKSHEMGCDRVLLRSSLQAVGFWKSQGWKPYKPPASDTLGAYADNNILCLPETVLMSRDIETHYPWVQYALNKCHLYPGQESLADYGSTVQPFGSRRQGGRNNGTREDLTDTFLPRDHPTDAEERKAVGIFHSDGKRAKARPGTRRSTRERHPPHNFSSSRLTTATQDQNEEKEPKREKSESPPPTKRKRPIRGPEPLDSVEAIERRLQWIQDQLHCVAHHKKLLAMANSKRYDQLPSSIDNGVVDNNNIVLEVKPTLKRKRVTQPRFTSTTPSKTPTTTHLTSSPTHLTMAHPHTSYGAPMTSPTRYPHSPLSPTLYNVYGGTPVQYDNNTKLPVAVSSMNGRHPPHVTQYISDIGEQQGVITNGWHQHYQHLPQPHHPTSYSNQQPHVQHFPLSHQPHQSQQHQQHQLQQQQLGSQEDQLQQQHSQQLQQLQRHVQFQLQAQLQQQQSEQQQLQQVAPSQLQQQVQLLQLQHQQQQAQSAQPQTPLHPQQIQQLPAQPLTLHKIQSQATVSTTVQPTVLHQHLQNMIFVPYPQNQPVMSSNGNQYQQFGWPFTGSDTTTPSIPNGTTTHSAT